jgi:DedD protein
VEEKTKVTPAKEVTHTITLTQPPLKEQILEKKPAVAQLTPDKSLSTKEEVAIKPLEAKSTNPKTGYIIQVVTCTKDNLAQEEAKKLQKQGFAAYAAKKNNFVVVYVGPFNDKQQALEQMEQLKKTYKDCILRRL